MTFEKREELIRLYDIYLNLLTNKQQQYFEEYYFDDLSISEIASNHEISRNAVFDQIKRVILNLEEYEKLLSETNDKNSLMIIENQILACDFDTVVNNDETINKTK